MVINVSVDSFLDLQLMIIGDMVTCDNHEPPDDGEWLMVMGGYFVMGWNSW